MKLKTFLSILGLCIGLVGVANANTINFDVDQDNNATFAGQSLNAAYSNSGLTFGADDVIWGDVGGTTTPPRGATGSADNFTSPLDITFADTANYVGASNMTASGWVLTAYDVNWNVLGVAIGDEDLEVAGVSAVGIKYAQFVAGQDGQYAIDDLSWEPVPEPATMAALGLGLAAVARRRRK